MSKECEAEMQRCPLQLVVLKCKKMMEEECPLKLISNALDPPDLSNYENTILQLKEVMTLVIRFIYVGFKRLSNGPLKVIIVCLHTLTV